MLFMLEEGQDASIYERQPVSELEIELECAAGG